MSKSISQKIYTVQELTKYLEFLIKSDNNLKDIWLNGEISNFYHHGSGHMYFTLKDDAAQIKAVMFKSKNQGLKFKPEDGLKVTAKGYLGIYQQRGEYQLYVDRLEPEGKGSLYLAYEQLKARLEKEGLFATEHKKQIPILPVRIGIVTSPTGAAIRDIISVIKRRSSQFSLLIVPSHVQGDKAAGEIKSGIDYLNQRDDIDLIIVSRGGGSIEDLWPFNEEIVARAIFNSDIPVISGVGHETDFTISDFVADLRAPTPSAAAELATASREELLKDLNNLAARIFNTINNQLTARRDKLNSLAERRIFTRPEEIWSGNWQYLDQIEKELIYLIKQKFQQLAGQYENLATSLDKLSPLKTLQRGYSLVSKNNELVSQVSQIEVNDNLQVKLSDGHILTKVTEIKKAGESDGKEKGEVEK